MFSFGKSRGGSLQMAVAGLGSLSTRTGAPSEDAKRVVAAFVSGRPASSGCGSGEGPACEMVSDGTALRVGTTTLASKSAPNTDTIRVCIPARMPAGNTKQTRGIRAVAHALMHALKTGIGVRRVNDDTARLTGRGGKAKIALPQGECLAVTVPRKMREDAAKNGVAANRVKSRHPDRNPSKRAVKAERKRMAKENRQAAADLARDAKKAKRKAAKAAARARKTKKAAKQAEAS